jgi:flagellar operon protein
MAPSQIGRIASTGTQSNAPAKRGDGFQQALNNELAKGSPVKLSAHAEKRLEQSNVQLSESDKARLGRAVDQMGEKGADRSLVLMDSLALVVSVKNRTVITAIDGDRAQHGAFTNIDSAIIV